MELNEREAKALLTCLQQAHCKDCDYQNACDHFDSFIKLDEAEQVALLNKLSGVIKPSQTPDSGKHTDQWYIDVAIQEYESDTVEFDDAVEPKLSVGEDGAWVSAWVWVADDDVHDGDETCRECGESYPVGGDGWDGMCPDCADKAEGRGMVICDDCGEENQAGTACACEDEEEPCALPSKN